MVKKNPPLFFRSDVEDTKFGHSAVPGVQNFKVERIWAKWIWEYLNYLKYWQSDS